MTDVARGKERSVWERQPLRDCSLNPLPRLNPPPPPSPCVLCHGYQTGLPMQPVNVFFGGRSELGTNVSQSVSCTINVNCPGMHKHTERLWAREHRDALKENHIVTFIYAPKNGSRSAQENMTLEKFNVKQDMTIKLQTESKNVQMQRSVFLIPRIANTKITFFTFQKTSLASEWIEKLKKPSNIFFLINRSFHLLKVNVKIIFQRFFSLQLQFMKSCVMFSAWDKSENTHTDKDKIPL